MISTLTKVLIASVIRIDMSRQHKFLLNILQPLLGGIVFWYKKIYLLKYAYNTKIIVVYNTKAALSPPPSPGKARVAQIFFFKLNK